MKYKSKNFRNENYFVLYDMNDNIICYFDSFEDLSKIFNYTLKNLVGKYNQQQSNIINIIIYGKKYKLATFC